MIHVAKQGSRYEVRESDKQYYLNRGFRIIPPNVYEAAPGEAVKAEPDSAKQGKPSGKRRAVKPKPGETSVFVNPKIHHKL